MIYITDARFAKRIMEYMGRDSYSIDALKHIMEYYDAMDMVVDFDPVGICGDWTEYTPDEFYEEWEEYIKAGMSDDQILEVVNDDRYAVKLCNGNFLILE